MRKHSIERPETLIVKNQAIRKHQFPEFSITEKPKTGLEAIKATGRWDGIKRYVTNNFELEQSFLMIKTDLRISPAFRFIKRRIDAHVIICMLSLCVFRILEQEAKPL